MKKLGIGLKQLAELQYNVLLSMKLFCWWREEWQGVRGKEGCYKKERCEDVIKKASLEVHGSFDKLTFLLFRLYANFLPCQLLSLVPSF